MSELERGLADAIPRLGLPTRWAAFNALRHLNRAYKMLSTDSEMAVFRAITAEEEAATALFRSLRRRGYGNAEKLEPRNHVHKNALIPFIDAISRVFAEIGDRAPETRLLLHATAEVPRMEISIGFRTSPEAELNWFKPVPPLHFLMNREAPGDPGPGVDFSREMALVASDARAATVMGHLRERANFRNRLLYAGEDGYPGLEGDADAALQSYQRNVFTIVQLIFLIDPYPEVQSFVQQSLDAFLSVLGKTPATVRFD